MLPTSIATMCGFMQPTPGLVGDALGADVGEAVVGAVGEADGESVGAGVGRMMG